MNQEEIEEAELLGVITGLHADYVKLAAESASRYTKEEHERRSARSKKNWEDPEYRSKVMSDLIYVFADPEVRAKRSKTYKRLWQDPDYRSWMIELTKRVSRTPEDRARRSEVSKRNWKDPSFEKSGQRLIEPQR